MHSMDYLDLIWNPTPLARLAIRAQVPEEELLDIFRKVARS